MYRLLFFLFLSVCGLHASSLLERKDAITGEVTKSINDIYTELDGIMKKKEPINMKQMTFTIESLEGEDDVHLTVDSVDTKLWWGKATPHPKISVIETAVIADVEVSQENLRMAGNLGIKGKINGKDIDNTLGYEVHWDELKYKIQVDVTTTDKSVMKKIVNNFKGAKVQINGNVEGVTKKLADELGKRIEDKLAKEPNSSRSLLSKIAEAIITAID